MISIEDARRFYVGADSVHDFSHVLRVLTLAKRLVEAEGADCAEAAPGGYKEK